MNIDSLDQTGKVFALYLVKLELVTIQGSCHDFYRVEVVSWIHHTDGKDILRRVVHTLGFVKSNTVSTQLPQYSKREKLSGIDSHKSSQGFEGRNEIYPHSPLLKRKESETIQLLRIAEVVRFKCTSSDHLLDVL